MISHNNYDKDLGLAIGFVVSDTGNTGLVSRPMATLHNIIEKLGTRLDINRLRRAQNQSGLTHKLNVGNCLKSSKMDQKLYIVLYQIAKNFKNVNFLQLMKHIFQDSGG